MKLERLMEDEAAAAAEAADGAEEGDHAMEDIDMDMDLDLDMMLDEVVSNQDHQQHQPQQHHRCGGGGEGPGQQDMMTTIILDSLAVDQFQAILHTEQSYNRSSSPQQQQQNNNNNNKTVQQQQQPQNSNNTECWRRKICQWSYKVIDHFALDREIVSCAMNILDRYLSAAAVGTEEVQHQQRTNKQQQKCGLEDQGNSSSSTSTNGTIDSRSFQLAAMTSLYIAMKVNDSAGSGSGSGEGNSGGASTSTTSHHNYHHHHGAAQPYHGHHGHHGHHGQQFHRFGGGPGGPGGQFQPSSSPVVDHDYSSCRKLRLDSFVGLSRGQFTPKQITDQEFVILKTLKWKVHFPTPMTCVSFLLKIGLEEHEQEQQQQVQQYHHHHHHFTHPPRPGSSDSRRRHHRQGHHSHHPSQRHSHPSHRHQRQYTHDLVLHVLHELARYLTELSVCVGPISSNYKASQIAYAAILVSMELLTEDALSLGKRQLFYRRIEIISGFGGGVGGQGGGKDDDGSSPSLLLSPSNNDIQHIQKLLKESFWPEMLISSGTDDATDPQAIGPQNAAMAGHPVYMAKRYGLLVDSLKDRRSDGGGESGSSDASAKTDGFAPANTAVADSAVTTTSPTTSPRSDSSSAGDVVVVGSSSSIHTQTSPPSVGQHPYSDLVDGFLHNTTTTTTTDRNHNNGGGYCHQSHRHRHQQPSTPPPSSSSSNHFETHQQQQQQQPNIHPRLQSDDYHHQYSSYNEDHRQQQYTDDDHHHQHIQLRR